MTKHGVSGTDEQWLLDSARRGDEDAYRELVEVHRAELHAHCYRMLASVPDAEDAVQDALVRAWRGLARFEGRSSVRTWLFKIATNTALDINDVLGTAGPRHLGYRLDRLAGGGDLPPGLGAAPLDQFDGRLDLTPLSLHLLA